MLKNASTEEKLLLLGYSAIAIAYTILTVIKIKHLSHK
jgi:hypothetical protein